MLLIYCLYSNKSYSLFIFIFYSTYNNPNYILLYVIVYITIDLCKGFSTYEFLKILQGLFVHSHVNIIKIFKVLKVFNVLNISIIKGRAEMPVL
jgi:hypothetical protein